MMNCGHVWMKKKPHPVTYFATVCLHPSRIIDVSIFHLHISGSHNSPNRGYICITLSG